MVRRETLSDQPKYIAYVWWELSVMSFVANPIFIHYYCEKMFNYCIVYLLAGAGSRRE